MLKIEKKKEKTSTPPLLACLLAAPKQYCKPWRSDDTEWQQSMSMDECVRVYAWRAAAEAGSAYEWRSSVIT